MINVYVFEEKIKEQNELINRINTNAWKTLEQKALRKSFIQFFKKPTHVSKQSCCA